MSTSGPDDPSVPSKPSPELGGLDPKDLLNASLETVPPVTLPPQPVDPAATIPMSGPRPTLAGNKDVDLPLPEELSAMLPPGAYHVGSFLGQGGMGAVYKGMQVRLKRPVAIKIMRRDLGKDHDFEARFEREAQAMAKLNHPNIVSVIDYGEAGQDYLYIVMELVDGADLMDVIRGGQMTQEMALSLLPQICDALQFAHDHGIVHRDIKPSNIMLTRDGRIKMADFGLAKHFDAESSFRTQTGTGMGTPDYAAPEQFSPDVPIDHRADIYALGVMIYQMITGQLPRGVWKPPSQRAPVAPQWDSIVSRAMQSDPADRYQQASEVKTDVSSIPLTQGRAAGPPAAATGPQAALGGPSALPRAKSRASLFLGLVGAAVAALGAFIFMKEPAPKNNEAQAAASAPASALVSRDAQVSRTQVTASAIKWQKAGWTAGDLKNKTIIADGGWAHIGQETGASNGWLIAAGGQSVTFQDGVVRLRYRWQGKAIILKTRNAKTFGQVRLWGPHVSLGIYLNSVETRLFQQASLPDPLKFGDEGTLEIAAIGNRLYARLNNSIVLSSPEIPELVPSGFCAIQSENASFRDVEYAILDGIADPLKALGWEVPNAIETALASVSPAVRPYVAYPERLKVPVPDWLRLASAEGGSLRIHTVGDPGAAKAALDLGEAARFDDFVFVAGQDLGWIAVRRNGELWGRNADYKGQPKSVGPIQIKSLSTGRNCHWLEEDGTGGTLYGSQHHTFPVSGWKSERVTAASLHSAVASFAGGKPYRLAFDSAGNLLAHFSEVTRPDYQFPPSDWFRGAPQPKLGDGLAALTHDGRVRTWDFTTGAAFPGMDEVRGVVQLAYGSSSAGWGVMLSETGQATVFGSKGTEVPEDLAPPAKGGPFIRVSPGPIFAAQKTDGSWVGWNSKERDLVAAIECFGPATSIASVRVSFRDGDYAEKPVNIPYLIYIQPKNGSKPGVSNAPAATTTPANVGEPLVTPLTWLPAVHSEGNAAKYHSQTPDGWITGTPDNPGGITASHPAGPLGNFVVRLRYRWNPEARYLQVRFRHPAPAGVTAQAVVFDGHWAISRYDVKMPPETRTQSLTSRKRIAKLEPGSEGVLEVAVIGDRVIARFDNTTQLDATVTGMSARGAASILSAGLSFRDVEMASLEGIADPLKALGWEVPLNWQKAAWSANEVAQKKIVVEDGWARIGQAAGALEKTWKLAGDGVPISLGDGAVRLRYRFEGRALTLKIRNHTTYGYVTLWPSRLDLGIWSTAYAEREKRVQTRALATPLKNGEEGILELVAHGRRLFARLNGSIVLSSEELPDLGLTGGCEIQSDGVSFRDVEYCHLSGIPDPLKALGWEVPNAIETDGNVWSDFFADWERSPDRNEFERTSLEHGPMGWQAARHESGANAYLVDSQGSDLVLRVTAKFDLLRNPQDSDQITVRLRRTPRGLPNEYNEYAIYLFRSGQADLRVIDDLGSRKLITAQLPAGFDPHQLHTLEISTNGRLISFLVDGQEMGTAEDETLPPGGRFGINGSQSVVFEKADYRLLDAPKGNPASATKENPFMNTLGMKFVPVPIGGGPSKGQTVLFSVWVTRVKDYAAFAKAQEAAGMKVNSTWMRTEQDGVPVGREPDHPVVSMSWDDAQAFCQWLTGKEIAQGKLAPGQRYRLPTDEEWSWAVGLPSEQGSTPEEKRRNNVADIFPWGTEWPPTTKVGNYADETFHAQFPPRKNEKDGRMENGWNEGYTDGFATTSPVGSFQANAYGLHDMGGNVWEWCEDWWNADNEARVRRGSSWRYFGRGDMRSSGRSNNSPTVRISDIGFRCVLETAPSGAAAVSPSPSLTVSSSPSSATKDAPFTNTLGMRFVPVPITGGPTDRQRVLFSIWETRVRDYEVFVEATNRTVRQPTAYLQDSEDHPVVNVTREDAMAFCEWLTERYHSDGRLDRSLVFRLPSDHEWSCAVGIGDREDPSLSPKQKDGQINDIYPWGTDWPPPPGAGNYLGVERPDFGVSSKASLAGYHDGYAHTAPVGQFRPNPLGLFDLGGNVQELTSDWMDRKEGDPRPATRGAAYAYGDIGSLRASHRSTINTAAGLSHDGLGFRVVLGPPLPESPKPTKKTNAATTTITPAQATTAAPFTNSLGMRFVPVPVTGGPMDGKRVLFSIWETRVQDYDVFVKEAERGWKKAEFEQGPTHPAVNVSWEDATAFCQWLTERERKAGKLGPHEHYRLPSDHEWSCSVGIGDKENAAARPGEKDQKIPDVFPWGTEWPPSGRAGNFAGEELKPSLASGRYENINGVMDGFRDEFIHTATVGAFLANKHGLHDLGGNVWEWCEDRHDKGQADHVLRGGSWNNRERGHLLSSYRYRSSDASNNYGFRCVLAPLPTMAAAPMAPASSSPAAATNDAPFINTLGMKFVPVPITGGPTDGKRVLFCIWETRVRDYEVFAQATQRKVRKPTFAAQQEQGADHPVVAVSREDAMAFCEWLTGRHHGDGRLDRSLVFRLPTDHEWSCAVGIGDREDPSLPPEQRGGITDAYPWGTGWPPPPGSGNYLGQERAGKAAESKYFLTGYFDGFAHTAPVGQYRPNPLGLFDLGGNVWELTSDWLKRAEGEPRSVTRGAAYSNGDRNSLRSAIRSTINTDDPWHDGLGFRVVVAPAEP